MKLNVITNATGAIEAILPFHKGKPAGEGAPSGVMVVPNTNQAIQEIEVPEEMVVPPLQYLAQRFRVENGKLIQAGQKEE